MISCPSCNYQHPKHLTTPTCLQCSFEFQDYYLCQEPSCALSSVYQPRNRQCTSCERILVGQFSGREITWGHAVYRVREFLGGGGMGEVYRGIEQDHATTYQKEVAVKFNKNMMDLDVVKRFQLEIQILSMLQSPHNIRVYTYGEMFEERSTGMEATAQFMIMELLKGQPLNDVIKQGLLPPDEVASIFIEICNALSEAHEKGIIHRDLKPHNIMLQDISGARFAKVFDFGLSRLTHSMDDRISTSGVVMGTFRYMSPEQALGEELDHRTDIFSLGVVFYEMVAGKHPFPAKNLFELFMLHQEGAPRIPYITPELEAVALKMIAYEKDHRFQSTEEIRQTLLMLNGDSLSGRFSKDILDNLMASLSLPPEHSGELMTREGVRTGQATGAAAQSFSNGLPANELSDLSSNSHIQHMHNVEFPDNDDTDGGTTAQQTAHPPKKGKLAFFSVIVLLIAVIGGLVGYILIPKEKPISPKPEPETQILRASNLKRNPKPPARTKKLKPLNPTEKRTSKRTFKPKGSDPKIEAQARKENQTRKEKRAERRRNRKLKRQRRQAMLAKKRLEKQRLLKRREPPTPRPIKRRIVAPLPRIVKPIKRRRLEPPKRRKVIVAMIRRKPALAPCPKKSSALRYKQLDRIIGGSISTRLTRRINRAAQAPIYDSGLQLSKSWSRAAVSCKASHLCKYVMPYVRRYCSRYRPKSHCKGYRAVRSGSRYYCTR